MSLLAVLGTCFFFSSADAFSPPPGVRDQGQSSPYYIFFSFLIVPFPHFGIGQVRQTPWDTFLRLYYFPERSTTERQFQ